MKGKKIGGLGVSELHNLRASNRKVDHKTKIYMKNKVEGSLQQQRNPAKVKEKEQSNLAPPVCQQNHYGSKLIINISKGTAIVKATICQSSLHSFAFVGGLLASPQNQVKVKAKE
ncbi:hypothetical protein RGQ29_006309 [Quercus rubra]|uniref:Uncharacterized protein n=1 Tax=Quercus rubra TaxID=3512 RepID=A0AAN7IBP2_QUERU|nr:hypothetical protein RGQ29_006309 [Quercus rubra]